MLNFTPNKLTLALLSTGLLSLSSTTAIAAQEVQAVSEENIEIIEVTGIRRSLAESQAIKMTESSIVEAISAEDIGKLPDVSVAESIARLPGIAAQRKNGRATVISVRGLSPDFTTATLNGREQVTTGDNRGVEFDQFPSELMSGVVVYKTPDAGLLAQAIGGTIDMQTIRPLKHGKQTISVGTRYEKNDLGSLNAGSEDTGHRLSFSYIDQFADDTIGVALGVANMSSPNQEERWHSWGLADTSIEGTQFHNGAKPYVRSAELERTGVMAVFEYQPNEQFSTAFDLFYSDFTEEQTLRGIEMPFGSWDGTVITDAVIDESGFVESGTISGVKGIVRNDYWESDSETTAIGWNTQYQVNDRLSVEADISYSKAERRDFSLESYATNVRGDRNGGRDTLDFVSDGQTGVKFSPGLDYNDTDVFKLGAARNWGGGLVTSSNGLYSDDQQDGFINAPEIEDELTAIKLAAEYEMDGTISSVEVGVNYSNREKSKQHHARYLTLATTDLVDIPEEFLKSSTSLDFLGMGKMVSYDSYALYKSGIYQDEIAQLSSDNAKNNWNVEEEVTTFYAQANLDDELFERGLKGNFGIQVVDTTQSSDGYEAIFNGQDYDTRKVSGEHSYTELLPSLNLSFETFENHALRFGAARTLARVNMSDMNVSAGTDYNADFALSDDLQLSPWSRKGGNIELDPWLAYQYDLSYEIYMDDLGYVSFAAFYKDLENYIYTENKLEEFSDISITGQQPVLREGYASRPENGEGGEIHGIEASFTLTGSIISDSLSGFGMIMSGSITDSEVKETKDSDPIALPGLSKKVLSTTLYYEDHGFQARVSSRFRSDFIGEQNNFQFFREYITVDKELVVDAQMGYDFTQSGISSLEGLSVLLQVNNLTDEPFTTRQGDGAIKDYQVYGRNLMLGMNYTF